MHHVLIVEDNHSQCTLLQQTLKNQYPDWNIETANNYEDGLYKLNNSLQKKPLFTLFLLDVQLSTTKGDRGGFFLAKELRKHPSYYTTPILFLTAISDEGSFALSEFHCYNYIAKPYTSQDILHQIEQMLLTGYLQNTISIIDTDRIQHKLFINDVYMIEAKSHSIIIHTATDEFTTREYSLEKIQKLLSASFIQCHRKYIINKQYITCFDQTSRYIQVGSFRLPCGRTYINNINTLFQNGGDQL